MIEERLNRLEQLFIAVCREHPDICPHDYVWLYDRRIGMNNKGQDIWERHYQCCLCGRKENYQSLERTIERQ